MTGIFKAYDVRGSYPGELDEVTAGKIGYAFARLLQCGNIVIGHDMRISSPALARAFAAGYALAGGSVTDIGMVSTPLLYYSIIEGNFSGGVMVTASHLPGEMNGFKLCRSNAIPLSGDTGLPELERITGSLPSTPVIGSQNAPRKETGMTGRYLTKLAGFVRGQQPLTIAVDAGDGMAGPESEKLFELIPFVEPDPAQHETGRVVPAPWCQPVYQ